MTLTRPDPFGLRQCDRTLAIVEREIRELRGDEMDDSFGPYEKNPRRKQEEEVVGYLKSFEWFKTCLHFDKCAQQVVRAIMRRYDLFPVEDEPRQD